MARMVGVGAFVIGGTLLFALGLFTIGDRQMAFSRTFRVYTEFDRITGLQPGAVVRISGARAGTIQSIQPPADPSGRFRVELAIVEDLHALVRTDSVASIEAEGLVGGTYLGIGIGSKNMSVASDDSTLPSREPFEITDMLVQMSSTIANVNQMVDLLSGELQQALDSITVTVENANTVINEVSDDAIDIAEGGARLSRDLAAITEQVRSGEGTVGRLLNDETLYARIASTVERGEAMASDGQQIVAAVRQVVEGLQQSDAGVTGLAADLRQTLAEARDAMAGFADNMEALKRSFFFRGFFNRRGYFDLDRISPSEYRRGALARGDRYSPLRVWLMADVLFTGPETDGPALTEDGRARLDSAMATFLDRVPSGVLVVEGYSRMGSEASRFRTSQVRAAAARDHLVARFGLDPDTTGVMPLGGDSTEDPPLASWNGEGIALAYFGEPSAR